MRYRYAIAAMLFLLCGAALAGPERVLPEGGAGAAIPGAPTGPAAVRSQRPPVQEATGPRISPSPTWTGGRWR